jgi:hypothetical protein
MALELDRNHLPLSRQARQDGTPEVDRDKDAVEQDQRFAATMDLKIHLQAIDRGVPGLHR